MSIRWESSHLGSQLYFSGFFTFRLRHLGPGKSDQFTIKLMLQSTISELLQNSVEHCSKSVSQLRPQERFLDSLGEIVEHVHRLSRKGQITPALPLVLAQLPRPDWLRMKHVSKCIAVAHTTRTTKGVSRNHLPTSLLLLALSRPLGRVSHVFLHLVG